MKKEPDLNDLGRDMKPHRNGARLRPLEVTVDEGGIERAIRKFTRAVAEDGVLKELKKRRHHVKPGQKRRIKEREAQRRRRKQTRVFRAKDKE
jgi:small subunit ribosomal protein S21